jgi:hypothetical protein
MRFGTLVTRILGRSTRFIDEAFMDKQLCNNKTSVDRLNILDIGYIRISAGVQGI